jgi:V/A-type H+-transporting ATPase subunit D
METIGRTRMNLLLRKRQAEVAQRGLELLRSKREALVREFFAVMGRVTESREQLDSAMGQALSTLTVALGMEGRASLRSAAYAAKRTLSIDLTERNVWGVRFPEIHYTPVLRALDARGYATSGISTHIDETARRFEQVLELILRSVSVELRLKKLGTEIKNVGRRINALNEVMIPALTREVRNIQQALEEREREDLFRMKRFKQDAAREAWRE